MGWGIPYLGLGRSGAGAVAEAVAEGGGLAVAEGRGFVVAEACGDPWADESCVPGSGKVTAGSAGLDWHAVASREAAVISAPASPEVRREQKGQGEELAT